MRHSYTACISGLKNRIRIPGNGGSCLTRTERSGRFWLVCVLLLVAATIGPWLAMAQGQATLTGDKPDYYFGDTVTLTGAGWQPGETVTMVLVDDPANHAPVTLTSVADTTGTFTNSDYVVQISDLGATLTVTATGDMSSTAQPWMATAYGLPTLTSDKPDYRPGQTVTLTGRGFQPGESVTMVLVDSPPNHDPVYLTAVADGAGNFTNSDYVVQESDLDVIFTVTATGDTGSMAQTTFTDATIALRSSATGVTANTNLTITKPAGVVAGDVMIANFAVE